MKNKPKHTAGPWVVTDNGQIKAEAIVRMGFSDYVCRMPYASKAEAAEMPRSVNDARLISAAPELLALCKETLEAVDLDGQNRKDLRKAIQAAIAKAEGK